MGLKIFGDDPANAPKPRNSFADDVVGRFRSGHQINGRPASLSDWRITTGDPDVAAKVFELFGGDEPQEWAAQGEDNLEVFTASTSVDIIIESAKALRQRMVLWGRNGKLISASDGEYLLDESGHVTDEPDPDASLTFQERKAKAKQGTGLEPDIELYFRLADEPDLGIFKFKSGSWGLAYDLARDDIGGQIEQAGGPVKATLELEPVSFIAKNGPMAGKEVNYTASRLELKGDA